MEHHLTIDIDATPEQVFAAYTRPDLVSTWRPAIAEVTDLSGPMDAVGTTFVTRYRGRTPDSRGEVLSSDPPRSHTIVGSGAARYRAEVHLADQSGRTTLTFRLEARLPGGPLGRLAERLFVERAVARETGQEFARLKALVETRAYPRA